MPVSQAGRRLTLLGASTIARRRQLRERAGALVDEVDWSELADVLRRRRLLAALGPRMVELADGRASEDFVEALEQAIVAGRRQGAFLQLVCQRVMALLAEAGIASTPLKGPMLSEAIYGDPGRRVSGDVDVLVAPERLIEAVNVVRTLGYGKPIDRIEQSGLPDLHFVLVDEQDRFPPVELHWRVHRYERDFARERLLPPVASAPDWRPEPVDELIALLLFYARDGFVDLRLASDVSAWWDAYGHTLERGALDERLRIYPALARVVQVAAEVAGKVVGVPTEEIFLQRPSLGVRGHIATRLANPNPHGSYAQLYADMGLIDGLLAPPGGFGAFVRRQLLLPRDVLAELDRKAPKRKARSPLVRAVGMLGRYALTMSRLALNREESLL